MSNDTWFCLLYRMHLSTEAVEGLALALEGVDDVKGRDGLAASMLAIRDGVANDVAEEGLEDVAGLVVHQSRDTLDATTTCQAADRRLRDALDVVTENLAVTLGAALSESLTTFTSARHCLRFNE